MSTTQHKKILFTGPVGAGKTTAIQTMSDVSKAVRFVIVLSF